MRLRPPSIAIIVLSAALFGVALLRELPVLAGFGAVAIAALGYAYARAQFLAARLLAGDLRVDLRFAANSPKTHLAGRPVRIDANWQASPQRLAFLSLRVVASEALRIEVDPKGLPSDSEPASRGTLELVATPVAAGPHTLRGIQLSVASQSPWMAIELFSAAELTFRAMPRPGFGGAKLPRAAARQPLRTTEGAILHSRRGSGTELRELREHLPGDPFKHIDWKASARLRRLVVREFETDATLSAYLAVDTSSSMRSGGAGFRAMDRAIDAAFGLARQLERQRDRFGAFVIDGSELHLSRAATGHAAILRISELFFEALESTEPAHLDEDEHELAARLGALARHAGRVAVEPGDDPLDSGSLEGMDLVPTTPTEALALFGHPPVAEAERPRAIAELAREVGLDIAPRIHGTSDAKTEGLKRVCQRLLSEPGGPHTLVLFSDLVGVDGDALIRVLHQLRRHGHRVVVFWVEPPSPDPALVERSEPFVRELAALLRIEHSQQQRTVARSLSKSGARVLSLSG